MSTRYGILLHVSSIPTREPLGNLGMDALKYLDFLEGAGASYWQILPIHPIDHVFSPYASSSAFAGEIRYIDINMLDDDELREQYRILMEETSDSSQANYDLAYQLKMPLLKEYFIRKEPELGNVLESFQKDDPWALDYCLYEALKIQFGGKPWLLWPEGIRTRDPHSLDFYRKLLSEDIRFFLFTQYLFYSQWKNLKKEAKKRNIQIVGDIPMYVPLDSVEVWCNPSLFSLDDTCHPLHVSGAPPDYFTPEGQKWNTPVYEWSNHAKDGYSWWKKRIAHAFRCFDVVRLDHFRGFESFWAVPTEDEDARRGHWKRGPGMDFLHHLKKTFHDKKFIVEDLGDITPEVKWLKSEFGYPGMRVLQFAFDNDPSNPHLPGSVNDHHVYYTGTHDNPPLPYWYATLDDWGRQRVESMIPSGEETPVVHKLLEAVLNSNAVFAMIQFQDLLEPSPANRMNRPGTIKNNWVYKVDPDLDWKQLTENIEKLRQKKPLE